MTAGGAPGTASAVADSAPVHHWPVTSSTAPPSPVDHTGAELTVRWTAPEQIPEAA